MSSKQGHISEIDHDAQCANKQQEQDESNDKACLTPSDSVDYAEPTTTFSQNIDIQTATSSNREMCSSRTNSARSKPTTSSSVDNEEIEIDDLPIVAAKNQNSNKEVVLGKRSEVKTKASGETRNYQLNTPKQEAHTVTNIQGEKIEVNHNYYSRGNLKRDSKTLNDGKNSESLPWHERICSVSRKWKIFGFLCGIVLLALVFAVIAIIISLKSRDDPGSSRTTITSTNSQSPTNVQRNGPVVTVDMTRAAEELKEYYNQKSFRLYNPISIASVEMDLQQNWVNVTIQSNREKTTDYSLLITRSFATEGKGIFVLEGAAGAGKTVLMRKIAHDWSVGLFPQFKLVIYVEFRILKKHERIEDLVANAITYYGQGDLISNAAKELLRSTTRDLLILLDGYDEQPASHPAFLTELFSRSGLVRNFSYKLIISWRTNYRSVRQDSRFGHGVIIGFDSEKQKIAFIANFFRNPNDTRKQNTVETQLKNIKSLRDICTNPLYMAMLCAVVNVKDLDRSETIHNIIELMERFALYQLKFHASNRDCVKLMDACGLSFIQEECKSKSDQRLDELWERCPFLHNLGKLAFDMLVNINNSNGKRNELSDFTEQDLSDHDILEDKQDHFGFLTEVDTNNDEHEGLQRYRFRFVHKTFQDFFAAFYCYHYSQEIPWDHISAGKRRGPSDFEYFIFRFALVKHKRDADSFSRLRPFFDRYVALELTFSKGDIETGKQLSTLLTEFSNVTELSLTGSLNQDNINITELNKLRSIFFKNIQMQQSNQTIVLSTLCKLPRLQKIVFRGECRWSAEQLRSFTESIRRLPRKFRHLKHLKIHCTDWPHGNWTIVADFLRSLANCSQAVQKLSIYKDEQDNWPILPLVHEAKSISAVFEELATANFTTLELSAYVVNYIHVNLRNYPSMKESQSHGRHIYTLVVAEHKQNTTLRWNLTRSDNDTEEQKYSYITSYKDQLKYLYIFGMLRTGNLFLPPMINLQTLSILNMRFARYNQSLNVSLNQMPSLRKLMLKGCDWSILQWENMIRNLLTHEHQLNHLFVHCTNWPQADHDGEFIVKFFKVLANLNVTIDKLSLIKEEKNDWSNVAISEYNQYDMVSVLHSFIDNFHRIELSKEFSTFFGMDMSEFPILKQYKRHGEIMFTIKGNAQSSAEKLIDNNKFKANDSSASIANQTLWYISRSLNSSCCVISATLLKKGEIVYKFTVIQKIRFLNLLISLTNESVHSHCRLQNTSVQVFEKFSFYNCSWTDARYRLRFRRALNRTYHPLKLFEFGCLTDFAFDYWTEKLELATVIKGFFVFEVQFGEFLFNVTKVDNAHVHKFLNKLPLNVKRIEMFSTNDSIYSSLSETIPDFKRKAEQKFLMEVELGQLVNRSFYKPSSKSLHLVITESIFSSEEKILFHLKQPHAADVSDLTISGTLPNGNLMLPPLPHLRKLTLNLQFDNDGQMIKPFTNRQMPKLESLQYYSCPYSLKLQNDIIPTTRSLLSLCALRLRSLMIRCPDWSAINWRLIKNFYSDLQNCYGTIDILYLQKLPNDIWPSHVKEIAPTNFTNIIQNLLKKSNFKKIALSKEFATYCKISDDLLLIANRMRFEREEFYVLNKPL